MNKYIFLDIDGVLVTDFDKENYDLNKNEYKFNLMTVENLNYIIEKTNALIIISSCWRYHYMKNNDIKGLQDLFKENGFLFSNRITGMTPKIWFKDEIQMSVPRGIEIKYWLRQNSKSLVDQYRYVIIDDDNDMMLWQKDNFIQTDSDKGLTFKLANDCIKILNEGKL